MLMRERLNPQKANVTNLPIMNSNIHPRLWVSYVQIIALKYWPQQLLINSCEATTSRMKTGSRAKRDKDDLVAEKKRITHQTFETAGLIFYEDRTFGFGVGESLKLIHRTFELLQRPPSKQEEQRPNFLIINN